MAKYKIIPSSRTIVQSPISIGHKAEKGVKAIEFDLTAWVETYGSGTATVIMRRWGDAIPYPIALEIDENNKATWTLSDTDTAKAGMAYAQLSYVVGETVVKKSDIYTFRVMDSLTGEGEPPEAYESWLEHLTHLAAEAMAEVLDIEGIVTDKTLTVDGGIADGKAVGDELAEIKADLDDLQEGGYVANQQKISEKINDWLVAHPEATTTVQDGGVTTPKLADGAVTDNKTADEYKNLFYEEVTVSTGRMSNTDYYLATVPKMDSENNIIPVSLSYNGEQNPLEQAWERGSTITVNGYCSVLYQGSLLNGIAICGGNVVNTRSSEGVASDDALYLGVKPDRTIIEYKMNSAVRPADMLADGCANVFNCYFKLVENGQIVSALSEGTIIVNGNAISNDARNPLMLMGVKQNGDIVFLACDGRSIINDGLTYEEAGNILISQGCDTVYNLDGGGSTCLVVRGSKLNRNIDGSGISVRSVRYAINVIKPSANTPTLGAYAKIGAEKQRIIEQIIPYINEVRDAPAITSLSLTPESEYVAVTRTNFTKSLKTVTLTAVFTTSASIAKNSNIFSVPSGAKPNATTDFICVDLDGTVFFVSILSSGYIRVLNKDLPAGTYRMNVSWQVQ